MIVPVVTINEKSPYFVEEIEHNNFVFMTRYGIKYNVGFSPDTMFYSKGCYQFYIINVDHSIFIKDPLVRETIEAVIEAFFKQEPSVLLYICDIIDGRQATRNRLFRSWYNKSKNKHLYTLVNKSMCYNGITFYSAIILKTDHTKHDEVIDQFIGFIESLPNKLDEL